MEDIDKCIGARYNGKNFHKVLLEVSEQEISTFSEDLEMNYGDEYLNSLLKTYNKQLRDQRMELKRLPKGELILRKQRERVQYMHETWDRDTVQV